MSRPESLRSWIVVDALSTRVPKFSEATTSYVAVRAMLVTLIDPGRSPGRAPVVIPRAWASSSADNGARRGGFVEPGASEGAGVGVGVAEGSGVGPGVEAPVAAAASGGIDRKSAAGRTGEDVDDATAGTTRTAIRAMAAATRPG